MHRACSNGHVHPIDPRAVNASDPTPETLLVSRSLMRDTPETSAMKSRNDVRAIPSARATIFVDGSSEVTSIVTVVLDLGEKSVFF